MSTPALPSDPEWPAELGCYDVTHPVTRRAARGRALGGRAVWLHWSPCTGDPDEPCGAEREYRALSVNPARAVPEPLDLIRDAGRCWAVTEVVEGVSLAQAIAEGREVDMPRIAACLLAALRRSHAAGWVHLDVKPANVMLRPDGSAVLVDWELATRVGRDAAPGSLGYAPPHAWEGGYRAETRNDTYSLAVLLAELQRGARLFTGTRAEVMTRQRAFRFSDLDACSAVARRIFAAADEGIGAEAADLPLDEALLDMRMDQVLRMSTHGAASGIVGAVQRSAPACTETVAFEDQRRQLVGAVAERWRATMEENAVALAPGGLRADPAEAAESDGAYLDNERRRLRELAARMVARLSPLGPGAVFVSASATAADAQAALVAAELERRFESRGDVGGPWRVVRVDSGRPGVASRGAVRGGVRDALQVAFATSHVSGALCESFVRAGVEDLGPALAAVFGLAREGGLVGSAGQVEIAATEERTQSAWIDELDRRIARFASRDAEERAASEEESASPLETAERRLLRGDLMGAYPSLVRLTTELLAASEASEEQVLRVVDLWLDYGNPDGAATALSACSVERGLADEVAFLKRHGRVAALRGDVETMRTLVSALSAAGCDVSDVEYARFQALVLQADGDLGSAHSLLRTACRRRDDTPTFVEALATWGTMTRRRGRHHSGRRLLRCARQLADSIGAMRISLRIAANLLSLETGGDIGTATASAWADLGARCGRWGLQSQARRHQIRAATLSVAAEDHRRAGHALAAADAARLAGGRVSAVWSAMERYVAAQLRARRDERIPSSDRPAEDHREPIAWRLWLASALADESLEHDIDLGRGVLARRARADCVRLSRILARWVARGGDASSRIARVLPYVDGAFRNQSPAVGALARWVTRGASDDWPLVGLLAVLRDALEEDETVRELAVAFHSAAFVWGDLGDSTAAAWLRSHAPEIDAGRPYGTFAWEWRLAMLRADTILGHEPDVDARLESVLDALEIWSASLTDKQRLARMRVVPFTTIAETAGLAGPEHLRIPPGGEALVAFRAHLRREAVRFRGSRGRAAGLERVLHSALRLRSGCTIDEVLQETVSGVLAVCRAERAVVVFEDAAGERRAKLATLERMEDVGASDAEVSQSAIEHARREGRACIFDDACGSAEFGDSPSVRLYRPRSLMIAPLQAHGETLGYLYVENRSLPKSFSQSDLQLLEGFASQAGLALDNARLVDELRGSLEELKRVRTEAVRAESLRVLGQMAGEVAHDFNNLLAVILGETQLLLQDRPDAGIERSLEVIERAAMDGAAAIRRIQSSTRARPREEFAVIDLGELVREVLDFTRVRWASGGNDPGRAIRTRCRSARGVYVSGLAPELREVFTNLVLNAVDAMPDGGDLLVAVRTTGDVAEVQVRDSGSGIAAEIVDRVFDPFFSTKGESGNGLGLAIAKEIVERHGGTIGVISEAACGTTIAVSLPSVEQPVGVTEELVTPRARAPRSATLPSRSVLVVDDEEGVLRVLSAMLRGEGFDVTAAASGEEATRRLESGERFDVVITDLYMPGTSGVEVIETTRRTEAARRVVVMSGYGDVVGEGRIARTSVDGVLAKPFTLADVRDAVG